MSSENRQKLRLMLQEWPPNMVATYPWLQKHSVYQQLVDKYVKSGWLKKIGSGAFIRSEDSIKWTGVVYALQNQLKLPVHVGSYTVFNVRGYSHFVRFDEELNLFAPSNLKLPKWSYDALKKIKFSYVRTNLFKKNHQHDFSIHQVDNFEIKMSSLEQAMLEFLFEVPQKNSYEEAAYLMEGLVSLRPQVVQRLLEHCNSIKVKRLFLHLASDCAHSWLADVSLKKVNLGIGVRRIGTGKYYDKKYRLYVPESPLNEGNPRGRVR